MGTASTTPILYSVMAADPAAHLFEASCTVQDPSPAGQRFLMPAWIPGSYKIREFARNIVQIEACSGGRRMELVKLDKHTWQCAPCDGPLTLRYQVYAWELSVRSAHLDQQHGFFNGTSLFLLPVGKETAPCIVDIRPPAGEVRGNWRIATTLPRKGAAPYRFGTYQAQNYQELIDHPVEMGEFTLATFEAGGVPHDVAITGRHRTDLERLCRDLQQICERHVELFGALPRMERYLFLVMVTGDGYGGLEHRSSTALLCSRGDLPRRGMAGTSEGYRRLLGLCSHEYFHLWNVKRITPAALSPCDLTRENHTRQLWAFEGITSYYDDLALCRTGIISAQEYLELLAQTVTRLLRCGGRHKQSLAESSFDAWTRFYLQDENSPNTIVSYYTKGALLALALDLTIRLSSNGSRSLDHLMRELWKRFGEEPRGVPEGAIEKLASDIAGTDLEEFFSRYLYGTEDLPLEELLPRFGVEFTLRRACSVDDKGGTATRDPRHTRTVLGATYTGHEGMVRLATLFDGGAARSAGLASGDLICALDNLRVTPSGLERLLDCYRPGETVTVHAFRNDELHQFELTLQEAPMDTCQLILSDGANETIRARRSAWLEGGFGKPVQE